MLWGEARLCAQGLGLSMNTQVIKTQLCPAIPPLWPCPPHLHRGEVVQREEVRVFTLELLRPQLSDHLACSRQPCILKSSQPHKCQFCSLRLRLRARMRASRRSKCRSRARMRGVGHLKAHSLGVRMQAARRLKAAGHSRSYPRGAPLTNVGADMPACLNFIGTAHAPASAVCLEDLEGQRDPVSDLQERGV